MFTFRYIMFQYLTLHMIKFVIILGKSLIRYVIPLFLQSRVGGGGPNGLTMHFTAQMLYNHFPALPSHIYSTRPSGNLRTLWHLC